MLGVTCGQGRSAQEPGVRPAVDPRRHFAAMQVGHRRDGAGVMSHGSHRNVRRVGPVQGLVGGLGVGQQVARARSTQIVNVFYCGGDFPVGDDHRPDVTVHRGGPSQKVAISPHRRPSVGPEGRHKARGHDLGLKLLHGQGQRARGNKGFHFLPCRIGEDVRQRVHEL